MTSCRMARRLRSAEDERGFPREICPTNLYRPSTHVVGTTTTTRGDACVSTTSASSTASTTSSDANDRVIAATTTTTSSIGCSSTAATTTTVTTTIRTVTTTCYCHCPSGRGTLKNADVPPAASEVDGSSCSSCSPSNWTLNCDVCERLHGSADEDHRRRPEMAGRFAPSSGQRGSSSASSSSRDDKRDLPEDPSFLPPTCDSNRQGPSTFSKYASSVVRWCSREDVCRTSCHVRWPSQWCVFTWSVLFLLLLTSSGTLGATFMDPSTSPAKKDGVCQSIDIRSSVNEFARLEGCRVVEGFVQILLIDEQHANSSSYANLTFPDLLEITGYLVLYRVNGLKSIGHLFPNLTVIRGHSLFINYALVAFEMMHLQEIGLHSLTDIQKGSVRFEKNPALCYVDTIDWDLIAKNGKGEHVISENKAKNVCPVCKSHCPLRLTKPDERLCWNGQHCQKVCNCGGNACRDESTCCHPLCLGSCTGETDQDCEVCKEVIVEGNRCAQSCGNGTFEFLNRRCVREDECRRMKKPREAGINVKSYSYKPFNGTCILECPPGYMDVERNGEPSCQKCEGPCLKECIGGNIDSIASAQKLRGCTHITGSLQIQIRGGKNIVKELEDNLHTIEEINGFLKIVRSFPLISLNFLKNLRVIRGNELDYGKYTLAVLDNQNLQELWDWDAHGELKILSKDGPAKVFFHFNSKLCIHQIEMLRKRAGLAEFTDLEVAPNSNGDKVACNVTELKITLLRESSRAALIIWEAFDHYDPRALLGYMVYIIEAPHQNVTMYDGRDACGGDGWRVDDVPTLEPSNVSIVVNETETKEPVEVVHILTKLKPYTQYAFYVKTYTIATERSGAQSKVMYFTTKPDAPSAPRALTTWSNSSSELVISWLPPLRKNGNLIHYLIFGKLEDDDPDFTAQRNYCDEPMLLPEKKPIPAEEEKKIRVEEEKDIAKMPDTESCKCTDRESDQSIREKEVSSSIAFEDALHNKVYVKRVSTRRRRDVYDVLSTSRKGDISDKESQSMNKTVNEKVTSFERKVSSANLTYVIKNLRHFGAYNIEVQACREKVPNDTSNSCSTKSMRTHRTLPLQSADDIPPDSFKLSISQENNSLSIVTLTWDEPKEPNGLIVAYQIEYKRIDIQDIKPTVVCITRQNFKEAGKIYVLKNLSTGNYSAKVRATSLAGNGNYSDVIHFYIDDYTKQQTYWIFIGSTFFILMIVTLIPSTYYLWKWKIMKDVPNRRLIATVNPEYVSSVPFAPDEWEVPRGNVELLGELGTGSFGMVYEGLCKGLFNGETETRCAVKTVNNKATDRERIEFLNEASVMKTFNSYHVVKLLGVVTRSMPPLVIMELMRNGDLKSYLRSHRPEAYSDGNCKQPPTLKRILQMAMEIADGMCYLAAKKFVHRDLAARNCMVAEDLTVKVGDFGMTRDVYETDYYRKGSKGLLPVRWMAPESLKDGVFSSFSDVWSYGVVLWEMVTLASQPYQGMSNDGVLRYVISGGTMERPENCPDALYNLMKRTWRHRASRRPTFIDIATILLHDCYSESFEKVSFYHSPQGIESRNQNSTISQIKWTAGTTLSDLADNFDDYADDVEEINHDYNRIGSFYAESDEDEPLQGEFTELGSSPVRYGRAFLSLRCKIPSFHNLNSYGTSTRTGVTSKSLGSIRQALNLPFLCSTVDKTITRSIPNYENRKPGVLSMSFPRHNFPFMDSVEDIVVDAVDGLTELDTVDNNSDDTINDDKSETNSVLEMNGNE